MESVIFEDDKFKKVDDTIPMKKGSLVAIIVDNNPKEMEGTFKGTRVVNVGPKLVEEVGGTVDKWSSQPISTRDKEAQWADEDFMDITIFSLAQTRCLPKLGEIGVDEGNVLNQNPTVMKKWRRKEKGFASSGQTKSQENPNGKRKYGEGNEDLQDWM
ncbi:unnamed protein product [Ilex paraguariensis]|uniref:Uncharacterized protein n=1 Tax=Ilex paraguariensis TaxID=185542 RepID=A0ABC8RT75_9AQUA